MMRVYRLPLIAECTALLFSPLYRLARCAYMHVHTMQKKAERVSKAK